MDDVYVCMYVCVDLRRVKLRRGKKRIVDENCMLEQICNRFEFEVSRDKSGKNKIDIYVYINLNLFKVTGKKNRMKKKIIEGNYCSN